MLNVITVIVFFSFISAALAADGAAAGAVNLLQPLLQAPNINTSGFASLPWQSSFFEKCGTQGFYFASWTLAELPGLVQQIRGAFYANVKQVNCRIRKVAAVDATWRAFICASTDLDPENFSSTDLVDFVRTHPQAVPSFTIRGDTTQSNIDFTLNWPLGVGSSVGYVQPPLREPLLVVFAEGDLHGSDIAISWNGTVDISGYGYVAGHVGPAAAPAADGTAASFS